MKINFENKTIWYYLELAALALSLVATVLYAIMAGGDGIMVLLVLIALIVGIAAGAAKLFVKNVFLDLIPAIALAIAFGAILLDGIPIITDVMNGVNFITGTLRGLSQTPQYYATRYFIYFALIGIATIIDTVAIFFDTEKA